MTTEQQQLLLLQHRLATAAAWRGVGAGGHPAPAMPGLAGFPPTAQYGGQHGGQHGGHQ